MVSETYKVLTMALYHMEIAKKTQNYKKQFNKFSSYRKILGPTYILFINKKSIGRKKFTS